MDKPNADLAGENYPFSDELLVELQWLADHSEFEYRPFSIMEWLGPKGLNVVKYTWDAVKQDLIGVFGEEFEPGYFAKKVGPGEQINLVELTGGVGTGKSTNVTIIVSYVVHILECLKNPQDYFGLMPGTKIAISLTSVEKEQTKGVIYHDIKQRFDHAVWFKEFGCMYSSRKTSELKFPKEIFIIPGDGDTREFLGYNVICGILEEIDDQKLTSNSDYGERNYQDIKKRVQSRFPTQGLVVLCGTMKRENGLAQRRWYDWRNKKNAFCRHAFTWEARGETYNKWFYFDPLRRKIVSYKDYIEQGEWELTAGGILKIPDAYNYRESFIDHPESSLRDFAGIPATEDSVFISNREAIIEAFERYREYHTYESPINENFESSRYPITEHSGFLDGWKCLDDMQYVGHIDLGLNKVENSQQGDHAALVIGCVPKYVDTPRGERPYFRLALAIRFDAPRGAEIEIAEVRSVIYLLREYFKFNIVEVTYDGFESRESQQELKKKGIASKLLTVDKTPAAYEDFREALYGKRIELPKLIVWEKKGRNDRQPVNILLRELADLIYSTKKVGPALMIDHQKEGTKDVSDACAAIVHNLAERRRLHHREVMSAPAMMGPQTSTNLAYERYQRMINGRK